MRFSCEVSPYLFRLIMTNTEDVGSLPVVDFSKPRYDQSTYIGRAKHFFETANPLNALVTSKRLDEAAKLIKDYKLVLQVASWLRY